MASWLMMTFLLTWQLAHATAPSEAISVLLQKYSGSADVLTVDQLQQFFDRIRNCSSGGSYEYNNTANCTDTLECSFNNSTSTSASAIEVLRKLDIEGDTLNATTFEMACPVILEALENQACGDYQPVVENPEAKVKPSTTAIWGIGFLAVTIISLCSLMGALVLPFMDKAFYKQLLTTLIGLAVGSLTGSSLFHLIPQTFNLANTDTHHTYLHRSLMMWGGVWVFFMTERIMKVITDYRQSRAQEGRDELASQRMLEKWQQWHEPSMYISGDDDKRQAAARAMRFPKNEASEVVSSISSPTELLPHHHQELEPLQDQGHVNQSSLQDPSCLRNNPSIIYDYQEQAIKASFGHQEKPRVNHSHGHDHVIHFEQGKNNPIATVAWMIIFGDGLHNFIDGLSIGAAFNESLLTGISISVAVLCEELPHELGDFAVLLNSGMNMKQALVYNFLSACTCYLGLVLGIFLGEASTYIFGFAAGMFLYISLVDMVPEMNEVAEDASKVSVKKAFHTLFLQNVGMGIGVLVLYILARFQDNISFG